MSSALEIRGLTKTFGGARALDGVDLSVAFGEVHGLLGENGSGKSTLIKILAGYHVPDAGELAIGGVDVPLPLRAGQARQLNLSFVHQDLGLIPSLTVVDNFLLTKQDASTSRVHISWGRERRRVREIFERHGLRIEPRSTVAELSPVERALLAIVRAVEDMQAGSADGSSRGVLVLDEPTVFLPKSEVDQLFALMRSIAADGSGIVFVSHDLDEALEITDRITVLRDGRVVDTVETATADAARLVELIVGRSLETLHAMDDSGSRTPVRASVEGLSGGRLRDVSFDVHEGEVLGLTGLAGSGFESVPYLVFGAQRAGVGALTIDGHTVPLDRATPAGSLERRIALVPADRLEDGCVGSLSVSENLALPVISGYYRRAVLDRGQMLRDAETLMDEYDVRPRRARMPYGEFSGGNQQKAILARSLRTEPRLLLLHEPTQGVDVGARQNIFELVRAGAANGMAVVCASSDYEQLSIICDRVLVFASGRIANELVGDQVTKERIVEQCYRTAAPVGGGDV